jgi:hypothetical protein
MGVGGEATFQHHHLIPDFTPKKKNKRQSCQSPELIRKSYMETSVTGSNHPNKWKIINYINHKLVCKIAHYNMFITLHNDEPKYQDLTTLLKG